MKKGRLAVRLSLLSTPDRGVEFSDALLALTGTLGLRMRAVERVVIPRDSLTLNTDWGPVRFKHGHYLGGDKTVALAIDISDEAASENQTVWLRPEHDDVARLAREHGLDYQALYDQLVELANDFVIPAD
jgi:uncharacterized protein (DUF111 family)